MGIGKMTGFAWFPCTWVDESGMLTKALDGALDSNACAEIGIQGGGGSVVVRKGLCGYGVMERKWMMLGMVNLCSHINYSLDSNGRFSTCSATMHSSGIPCLCLNSSTTQSKSI